MTDSTISFSDQPTCIQDPVVRKWKCCCCPAPLKTTLNPKCSCWHNRCSSCAVVEYIQQYQEGFHNHNAEMGVLGLSITENVPRHETALPTTAVPGSASGKYRSSKASRIPVTLSHTQKSQRDIFRIWKMTLTHYCCDSIASPSHVLIP